MSRTSIVTFSSVVFLQKVSLFCHLLNILANGAACTDNKCVGVEVYYESLCPDSIRFITTQLVPAYSDLKEHVDIEFIPYGKATHEEDLQGKWTFTCQHGQPECDANKYQACALNAVEKFEPSSKKQDIKVRFVNCAMLGGYQKCVSDILNAEAQQYVDNCANSSRGDELLVMHGDKTHSLQPSVTFIPTIVINRVYSAKNQQEARTNFKGLICNYLVDSNVELSACV